MNKSAEMYPQVYRLIQARQNAFIIFPNHQLATSMWLDLLSGEHSSDEVFIRFLESTAPGDFVYGSSAVVEMAPCYWEGLHWDRWQETAKIQEKNRL